MGMQSILGTPLFLADVFQWARFRNGCYLQRHLLSSHAKPVAEKNDSLLFERVVL